MRISDWSSDVCSSDLDPALGQANRYVGLSHRSGLRVRFIIDTHTHADHFSAVRQLKQEFGAATVMHRESPSPHVDIRVEDGHLLPLGELRLNMIHTPGHTRDSMCVHVRSEEHTSELQSLMRISYAVFCLKKKT